MDVKLINLFWQKPQGLRQFLFMRLFDYGFSPNSRIFYKYDGNMTYSQFYGVFFFLWWGCMLIIATLTRTDRMSKYSRCQTL